MEKLIKAIKAFLAVLGGAELTTVSSVKIEEPKKEITEPVVKTGISEFEAGAVYALSLLQREGRLVDFLQEDLSSCTDTQIGSASRQIHDNCSKVLKEKFGIVPVAKSQEGEPFTVPEHFDPCELKLTGNVPEGEAPGEGKLLHKGWKAVKLELPIRTGRIKPEIICQAEVGF